MKLKSFLITALVFCHSLIFAATIPLWENGKSNYQIVLPDKYDQTYTRDYLKQAATRLQQAIKESSGCVEPPIVFEAQADSGKDGIYIGNTAKIRSHGVNPGNFEGFKNLILVKGKDVFLAGSDHKRDKHYYDNSRIVYTLGSVRAIVRFMREQMGVHFVMPGEIGTTVPKLERCIISDTLESMEVPRLMMSYGRPSDIMYDYSVCNFGWGSIYHYMGHLYPVAIRKQDFAETHPEYFILSGGKRDPSVGHLCISNPDVQARLYREIIMRLDNGAYAVQLGQTDGYVQCECEPCKAFGNTDDPAEKLWILHRQFAEKLKSDRPGKALIIIAYAPTWEPPKTFDTFPGNVYIELCRQDQANIDRWSKIKGILGFSAYLYNWGNYQMPGLTAKRGPRFVAEQMKRLLLKHNFKSLYLCGYGELYGMEGPGYYVYGRMLENPEQDWKTAENDYYEAAFCEVSALMRGFYKKLFERLDGFSTLENIYGGYGTSNQLPSDPRALISYIYSPDVLDVMERKLAGAESAVKDPKVKIRLSLVRKEFDYAKSLAKVIHCYNAYRVTYGKDIFAKLGDAVKSHKALIASYYDEKGEMKPFPNWGEIKFMNNISKKMLESNGRLRAEIGAPLNWNIDLLLKKGVLPGAVAKSMNVNFTTDTPGLEDFNGGAWSKAEWQTLNGIQLGEIKEHTNFKVLYDKKNIYFAFETDLPAERKHKNMGRDGNAWLQDCLEIMIDPYGMREVSMHYVFNPLPNSCYEGAMGLITDVLHPKYGKEDVSWNGPWTYSTKRQNGKWYALVSIPFESLGVPAPANGTVWTMNVARQAYWSPEMKWEGELSLWSPNLENMSINSNLNSFGEIRFK